MKTLRKLKEIKFGWKHISIIFLILIVFQIFVSNLQHNMLHDLVADTMDWSRQNSAEQIGNMTATALELLLEVEPVADSLAKLVWEKDLIHSLNSILKQPLMNRNVMLMCVILPFEDSFVAMDVGQSLYNYIVNNKLTDTISRPLYNNAVSQYATLHEMMAESELTTSFQEEENLFNVFVPFVPDGEYSGVVYLKVHPDVSFIGTQILSSFNQTVLIFSFLIILSFMGMFYISTYTIIDRDEAREELYREREEHLADQIAQKKEHQFTKRIYHTHHKAEKIMGFINEDVELANERNVKNIKNRIAKYANFISRIIYDMKWFNPPIQTIRGPIFRTNINKVLKFIVDNIFLRVSYPVSSVNFNLELDDLMPIVYVNEFVIWEVLEPLIQNAIDHATQDNILVTITTKFNAELNSSILNIKDNGSGIINELLEKNEDGIKKIFLENISTKVEDKNRGYGCFLAFEISKRCGWGIDAMNDADKGACFSILIKH